MKNFDNIFNKEKRNSSRESDFKRRDSGKKRFGDRDRGRPQMHDAICSDCGRKCQVPFLPTSDKPVYCSECFTSRGGGSVSDRTERRDQRPRFQDKKMFDAICATCGKRFELPFRPTEDRPVYCKDCFDKNGDFSNKSSKTSDQYKDQFDALNAKLDRILKILNPSVKEEKKDVVIERKEIKIEKKEKPKKIVATTKKEKPKKSAVVAKKEKPKNLKKTASKKVAIKKKSVKK